MKEYVNPDCIQGKHDACNRDAWDELKDQPTDCACFCHLPNNRSQKLQGV